MNSRSRKSLLIISSVLPFPRISGQQQRVYYKLKALREYFHITFLTVADNPLRSETEQLLLESCDEAIVLPARYSANVLSRVFFRCVGFVFSLFTGLKFSNYLYGSLEFPPARLLSVLDGKKFDAVLFEYWHAHRSAGEFKKHGMVTILDMHDILWQSLTRQLELKTYLPRWGKQWRVNTYRSKEEAAWSDFEVVIAINKDEYEYTRQRLEKDKQVFLVPMGTDIAAWPYSRMPQGTPRRIAYYGGMANIQNQQDAVLCYKEIMPVVWQEFPHLEFWIAGSNPPEFIKKLDEDPRVRVTGFLDKPQETLKTMSLVLCPWSGTFGFRSRVVEVMALGLPVVASQDAIHGMGFRIGDGILIGESSLEMAELSLKLLKDQSELENQSRLARSQIENSYSYESTYGKFAQELFSLIDSRKIT